MNGAPRPLSIYLVAAEESGDALGAALARALVARCGGVLNLAGVGGRAMAAAGIASPFAIDDLAIVGFNTIPRRLPMILRRIRETTDAIVAAGPDAVVIIDSPDFTHRIARRVRARAPSIPIIDYVSPSVWAWRSGRARAMRAYVDCVLAILPFEPAAHLRLGGPPCIYVGHPLTERLSELRPGADEAVRRKADPPFVLVLPGSRSSEIRRLLSIFGNALARVSARIGPLELVLPTLPHLVAQARASVAGWAVTPRIVVDPVDKSAAFRSARVALAASGTVTLELALAGVPTVAAYKVTPCRRGDRAARGPAASPQQRDPRQSRPRRERRAGIFAARLHAATAGGRAHAAFFRYSGAAEADRRFCAARSHYGIGRGSERQGGVDRPRYRPTRPPRPPQPPLGLKLMACCRRCAMQCPHHPAIWKRS